MWSIIREFTLYLICFVLITIIVYHNRQPHDFHQVHHMERYFLNARQGRPDYRQISTTNSFWNWLESSFLTNIRAQSWYNGDRPRYLSGFLDDKTNRLIGWPTMRQLRVKSNLCDDQRVITNCFPNYNSFYEDKHSYEPGWIKTQQETFNSVIHRAFQYRSSNQLDTYPYTGEHATYEGGGYVYEFRGSLSDMRSNLSLLHRLGWVNNHSRAILIQMTLYNPNVQLFTSATLMAEILSSGGVFPSAHFEPIQFYTFTSSIQLICTIIYLLLICHSMFNEIRSLYQLRLQYFRQFWSYIEVGIISCSIGFIGIYVWRHLESRRLHSLFEQTNGYVYINLQLAVYVNDTLTFLLGFCSFFAMFKFIRLFHSNRRLSLFTRTLHRASSDLLHFAFMFSIIFISFLSLFHLLFISKISACATLFGTAQMLFEITLMKFDTTELIGASAILGPTAFALFILLVVFVCFSMFVSIISDSFKQAREDSNPNQDIWRFIWNRFLLWTHLKKTTIDEIQAVEDSKMRSLYIGTIENFPTQVDRLLTALNQVYLDQQADLAKLKKITS